MGNVEITAALGHYDRHWPLFSGEVWPEGIDLKAFPMTIEEIFWRQARFGDFHVSEFPGAAYVMRKACGDVPFTAIPVFPSRAFRHNAIYINGNSGINRPEDLKGKRMGIPQYEMTAFLWIRDFLERDYGVRPSDMEWFTGGQRSPGRKPRIPYDPPPGVTIHPPDPERTLDGMLERGEIDALMATHPPQPMLQGSPHIRRLFPNFKEVEADYYRRTGLFPIMHVVVVRNDIVERYPWVPMNLYWAFVRAKELALQRLRLTIAHAVTLPITLAAVEESVELMGEDFWPYGAQANRTHLEHLARMAYEQGLAPRQVAFEEFFPAACYEEFKV